MSISLNSEDLKKEHERQRKRGKLIFKTLRKGIISLHNDEDPNINVNFRYEMENANVRSVTNVVIGDVICIVECLYDDIDIFKEDGSELTEKLPLWMVVEIENEIKNKFNMFNVELNFMSQLDILTGKSGKRSLVNENKTDSQRMIDRVRVIYRILKRGGKMTFSSGLNRHEVHWTLPNKFYVKIKHHNQDDVKRYNLTVDSYPILLLNTETINYTKTNGEPIRNTEKHFISGEITTKFKKYGITVYWGGDVPKYSVFSPNSVSPDETYTEIDITPKSK